jgi:hypothetical protein
MAIMMLAWIAPQSTAPWRPIRTLTSKIEGAGQRGPAGAAQPRAIRASIVGGRFSVCSTTQ